MSVAIDIDRERIAEFCRKWKVSEFSLFGSVLRQDFEPGSDIDVLVDLEPESGLSLLDWVRMRDELSELFARSVDLVDKRGLCNPYRRRAILGSREILYERE